MVKYVDDVKVGDKVICYKTHQLLSMFGIKVGDIFTVKNSKYSSKLVIITKNNEELLLIVDIGHWPCKVLKKYNEVEIKCEEDYYKWLAARHGTRSK